MIRFIHLLGRRFATCLAVAAALAFVADGALGADHHLGAAPASGGHYHAHAHSHAGASDHQLVHGDVADSADLAAAHDGFAPASGAEAGCCFCACCAGIVLPSLSAHAAPFVLLRTMATVNHRHGDGVVPDGLRRPPRTIAIT
jgi:hypothetical protein